MFSDDAYNKNILRDSGEDGAGTLIGNWFEERVLRDSTGEGRTVAQRHIPRAGLLKDFTKTPVQVRKGDNTFERVYGAKTALCLEASSRALGAPDKHAGKVLKIGPRELALTAARREFAEGEVQAEEAVIAELANVRSFSTTTGTVHCKPDALQARRAEHARQSFQEDLMHGPTPNRSLVLANPALDVPSHTHYSNAETITHARMALGDAHMSSDVKVSAASGFAAFGRNAEFSKPILEFTRGAAKDEEVGDMYQGLKQTDKLRHIGGDRPRGVFGEVPALTALKTAVHVRVFEAWGPYGYVTLRQKLFDRGDPEGFVDKAEVAALLREELGLSEAEVSSAALEVYLKQLITMKKSELRIGPFMSSLRPEPAQRDKRRIHAAFQSLSPSPSGEVRVGDWLGLLQDPELRAVVVRAFGAQDEEMVSGTTVTEQVFTELFTDLAALVDLDSVLP